ncbi:MAG: amidoligase family protein [Gammaproteobacteria bacterium SHHR-1]|uniref:amidoligase family protein n=1 Tax=Magnetovirga frankeli TaxID=947516 RepID=UPI001293E4A7|nr:amidoligase family protein [gamma proteobacterium SS-5]
MNQTTITGLAEAGFCTPTVSHNAAGEERRVGFELEFSGISLEQTGAALSGALGGQIEPQSAAELGVEVADLGRFNVELDWAFLKRQAGGEQVEGWVKPLSEAAALLVPVEVVCPPLALSQLPRLDAMVEALRRAGAQGTEESLIAAYGVHINAEIPRLDAATLAAYLRAFALLQWWLVDAHEVDLARKISPYVDLYPEAYVRQLFSRAHPGLDDIFADYLQHNPSRNRALDLLPLLAEIDEKRVRERIDDAKIKPRPAFHYRLPNCQIERADWSLSDSWNTWCVVEALAARPDELAELGDRFLHAGRPLLGINRKDWLAFIDSWLRDHALA